MEFKATNILTGIEEIIDLYFVKYNIEKKYSEIKVISIPEPEYTIKIVLIPFINMLCMECSEDLGNNKIFYLDNNTFDELWNKLD